MVRPLARKINPVLDSITEYVDKEESKPKNERDEQALVNKLKVWIRESTSLLKEMLETVGTLDPNILNNIRAKQFKGEASPEEYDLAKQIANSIKTKAFEGEASPEECNLADILANIAVLVVNTMNSAKKKLKSMSFAKKELESCWDDLSSALLQITAFIGLLLPTVLWIAGNLLNNRGHGSVIRLLLGGLGLKKLLMRFGLADALKLS
jgi:hypothetical protein